MKENYSHRLPLRWEGRDGCENTLQCNSAACSPPVQGGVRGGSWKGKRQKLKAKSRKSRSVGPVRLESKIITFLSQPV